MQRSELLTSRPEPLWQATLLLAAVVALAAVPPAWVERLPSVCLNRHILGFCPACGSLRALVHLFHGALGPALRHNLNCLLTGPILLMFLLVSIRRAVVVGR
jgi:putative effector of murein hydrolase LrgA (UPF0299 family)